MRDGEGVEVLRARLAAPFAQVGAVLAPRALAADDVPEDGREAVAQLLLEARAGPEQVEILRVGEPVRLARLALLAAVRQVLQGGLALLGVSAPQQM